MNSLAKYAENEGSPLLRQGGPFRSALTAALVGAMLGGGTGAAVGAINRIGSIFDPVARTKRRLKREEQRELDARYKDLDATPFATTGKGLRSGALAGAVLSTGLYGLNKVRNGERILSTGAAADKVKEMNPFKTADYSDESFDDYVDCLSDDVSDYEARIDLAVAQKIRSGLQQMKTASMPNHAAQGLNAVMFALSKIN
jgi:hypothetical protein